MSHVHPPPAFRSLFLAFLPYKICLILLKKSQRIPPAYPIPLFAIDLHSSVEGRLCSKKFLLEPGLCRVSGPNGQLPELENQSPEGPQQFVFPKFPGNESGWVVLHSGRALEFP